MVRSLKCDRNNTFNLVHRMRGFGFAIRLRRQLRLLQQKKQQNLAAIRDRYVTAIVQRLIDIAFQY